MPSVSHGARPTCRRQGCVSRPAPAHPYGRETASRREACSTKSRTGGKVGVGNPGSITGRGEKGLAETYKDTPNDGGRKMALGVWIPLLQLKARVDQRQRLVGRKAGWRLGVGGESGRAVTNTPLQRGTTTAPHSPTHAALPLAVLASNARDLALRSCCLARRAFEAASSAFFWASKTAAWT